MAQICCFPSCTTGAVLSQPANTLLNLFFLIVFFTYDTTASGENTSQTIYFIPLSSTIHLFNTVWRTLPAPLEIDTLVHDKQKEATCLPLHNPVGMSLEIPSCEHDRTGLQDSSAALLQMMS